MTNRYTDKSGKEYQYHEEFQDTKKDLVIISSDGIAFRVDCGLLKYSSPIFRSMFFTCDSNTDNHLSLDHSAKGLAVYLLSLSNRPPNMVEITWESFKEALTLCTLYDTSSIGNKILHQTQPIGKFGHERYQEMFIFAAKSNDILTGCRLLLSAVPAFCSKNGYNSQDFEYQLWRPSGWPKEVIVELPPDWIWAYMRAHMGSNIQTTSYHSYWTDIAVRFMKLFLP